jgi:hypothetical protein
MSYPYIIYSLFYTWSCPTTRQGGAWGERRYSYYSLSTSALDGGEWSASRPGRSLTPGKGPPVPIVQDAGWASEPVWTQIYYYYLKLFKIYCFMSNQYHRDHVAKLSAFSHSLNTGILHIYICIHTTGLMSCVQSHMIPTLRRASTHSS